MISRYSGKTTSAVNDISMLAPSVPTMYCTPVTDETAILLYVPYCLSSITASVINMPIAVTSIIINPSENLKPAVTYSSSLSDVTAFSLVSFVSAASLFIIFENSSASPFAASAAILTLLIKPSIYTEI